MKDIMKKLAELEATAPKTTKKKMLNEDSTTPPMNVGNKPASFKDVFENMASQKPIPVVGKQGDTQKTGAGFLNINDTSPAGQAMQKALTDLASQGKAQIVVPTNTQNVPPGAGAAGVNAVQQQQQQQGQQQVQEKWGEETEVAPSEKGKYEGKTKAELTKEYNKLKATGPHKKGSKEFGKMRELSFAIRAKSDWGKVQEEQIDELSPKTLGSYTKKASNDLVDRAADHAYMTEHGKAMARNQAKGINRQQGISRAVDKLSGNARIPANEGAKVDRMVKHIEKSERGLGKSKEKASDIAWATANKRGMLDNKNKKKVKEGDIAPTNGIDTRGAGLGAGRSMTTLEGKSISSAVDKSEKQRQNLIKKAARELNSKNKPTTAEELVKKYDLFPKDASAIKKMAKELAKDKVEEGKKPDFLDLDKDGNKKESMKKAAADKKKKVNEAAGDTSDIGYQLQDIAYEIKELADNAMRLVRGTEEEGRARSYWYPHIVMSVSEDHGYMGKNYTMMDSAQSLIDGSDDESMFESKNNKKKKVKESMNHKLSAARLEGKTHGLRGHAYHGKAYEDLEEMRAYHEGYKEGLDECYGQGVYETAPAATVPGMASSALSSMPTLEDEMEEGNAFTAALAKTPKGGKFSVGGNTYTDTSSIEEYAFESLDKQLNALLKESENLSEGLSVSVSKGQQNSPDSVTITAQDAEADQLLQLVKHAGLGLFGDEQSEPSSAMSVQPSHGEPDEVGAGGADVEVVDGNDGIMGLMQKLSGIQAAGSDDYEDEEGDEEQLYGNHSHTHEETCNECGGMMEAGHSCGSKMDEEEKKDKRFPSSYATGSEEEAQAQKKDKMVAKALFGKKKVDEEESEDQMEFEVSEDNAPDSDEAETSADEDAEAKEDAALAGEKEEEMNESFASILERLTKLAEGSGDKPKHPKHDEKDDKDWDDEEDGPDHGKAWYDTSDELKEDTEEEDEKAEKAGKKVTKDIEYDDKKEKIDEWANEAGKKGTDASFEQDIDFMTKVISGGLNKPKSTGQTTVPVIAGQTERMTNPKETVTESVSDWVKLAGIKKS